MKFRKVIRICPIFLVFAVWLPTGAQDFPSKGDPPKLVTDLAGLLSTEDATRLEDKLVQFDDSSSTQIAIVTVKTIGPYSIADYSFGLGEAWGIGQEGFDNGILILVVLEDRKMFIATGYGVEAYVPDAIAKRIVEGTLKPNFRQEQYYKGLDEATNILIGLTSGQFSPEQLDSDGLPLWPFLLLMLFFILVVILISRNNRGGGRRAIDSRTLMGPYRGSGGWTDFSGGSGTFGGGSGGGFGGFGGGSFGGGGAGGSW
ncbi:MAG: TPM domain-containing protein [Cyclobacteriaceae bacterium]